MTIKQERQVGHMKILFNQQGKARKQMVGIISETLNQEMEYSGAPRFEYRIGNFTLTKDGTLIFDSATVDMEQLRQVLNALKAGGFDYEGSDCLEISYPLAELSEEAISNIHKMVDAKAPLLKMALKVDDLPIEVTDTDIVFPWLRQGLSREETYACGQLITQICKAAKEKKRVTAAVRDFTNPRFSFRVWMISLGMVGPEFATARRVFCKDLPGNAAWSSGIDPRRKVKAEILPETAAEDAPEAVEME